MALACKGPLNGVGLSFFLSDWPHLIPSLPGEGGLSRTNQYLRYIASNLEGTGGGAGCDHPHRARRGPPLAALRPIQRFRRACLALPAQLERMPCLRLVRAELRMIRNYRTPYFMRRASSILIHFLAVFLGEADGCTPAPPQPCLSLSTVLQRVLCAAVPG